MERTLGLLKPDVFDRREEIEQIIISQGFTILERCELQITEAQAGEFYAEHVQKSFFADLLAYVTSGPIVALALASNDAISKWRLTIGPTSVVDAKVTQPDSLRAQFGTSDFKNGFHGSADEVSAEREIALFFPQLAMQPSVTGQAAKAYLAESVNPMLLKGLTELCKAKPSHPVIWLADWLLINNPNKSKSQGESEGDTLSDDVIA